MTTSAQIANLAGAAVTTRVSLHGGDLSVVERVDLADGRSVVAKHGPHTLAEAGMLCAMAKTGTPVPAVLGQTQGLILLEYLPETPPSAAGWAALGRSLRQMHDSHGDTYGWPEDYAFGKVTISNTQMTNWPQFWANNRLLSEAENLPPDISKRLQALAQRLPEIVSNAPPAALLHGDLWGGNILFSDHSAYLIDPACYYGDPEVDLAMLTLFGRPPASFFEAYGPLRPGHEKRRPVYQLWPALVHLRLFGAGYRGMVTGLLDSLGA